MKKIFLSFVLAMLISLNAGIVFAGENPIAQLTGNVWMESSQDVKKALLYGVECAVAMEYLTARRAMEKAGKEIVHEEIVKALTAFPENWILAFQGVERSEIVNMLDAWYLENPIQTKRPVFDVLWYEIMEPKLDKR